MNFTQRIMGLFTSPDKTMEDVAREPRIEEALVIVAVYAILTAIGAYMMTSHLSVIMDNAPAGYESMMKTVQSIGSVVVGLIWPFVGWIIATVVLYLLAMAFGGTGKFIPVLTGIGMSTVVKVLAMIVGIILITQMPYSTVHVDYNNPYASISSASAASNNIFSYARMLVDLIGLLWSCLLGVYAIKHTEKLSLRNAALVVGIPTALYLLFQYGTTLWALFFH